MKLQIKLFVFMLCSLITQAQEPVYQKDKVTFYNLKDALKNPFQVKTLHLTGSNESLQNIDFSVFKNLEFLSLKEGHLDEIPQGITQLKSLKVLDLSGNNFKKLPTHFKNLKRLHELYLNEDKNLQLNEAFSILAEMPNLKYLHLENDNLDTLPNSINKLKFIEKLYLNNNHFKEIPNLQSLDHLIYLDLKDNQIQPEVIDMRNLNFGFKINF